MCSSRVPKTGRSTRNLQAPRSSSVCQSLDNFSEIDVKVRNPIISEVTATEWMENLSYPLLPGSTTNPVPQRQYALENVSRPCLSNCTKSSSTESAGVGESISSFSFRLYETPVPQSQYVLENLSRPSLSECTKLQQCGLEINVFPVVETTVLILW